MSSMGKRNLVLAVVIALVGVILLVVLLSGLYCYQRYRRRQQTIPLFEHSETQSKERHLSMAYQSTPLPKLELHDMGTVFNPTSLEYNGKPIHVPPSLRLSERHTLPISLCTTPYSGHHDAIRLTGEKNSDQQTKTRSEILAFPLPTASTDVHFYLENQEKFGEPTQNNQVSRWVAPIPTNTSGIPNATIVPIRPLCDAKSMRSLKVTRQPNSKRSQTQGQISASQTFPARRWIVATALKAPMSYAKAVPADDILDSTLAPSLASIHAAGGFKGTRPTTHSYRAWLTNLPQPTWTTVEPPGRKVKTVTQRKGQHPALNEVLVDNDVEERRWVHGNQPHEAVSSTGPDIVSLPQPQQEKRDVRSVRSNRLIVPQEDTGKKTPNASTIATPAVTLVSKIEFQPFKSLYLHNAQAPSSNAGVDQGCLPTADVSKSGSRDYSSIFKAPSTKIGNERKEHALELGLFDFSFDTDGPNLDFHLDFGVKEGFEITTIPLGKGDAEKSSKAVRIFETLVYASPSMVEAKNGPKEKGSKLSEPVTCSSPLPSNKEAEEDLEGRKYTLKVHTPKAPSHSSSESSSSESSSSSTSILSWLPIREPLTPRFNHLRAVLEGNTKGWEETLPQWPPGVKIGSGG